MIGIRIKTFIYVIVLTILFSFMPNLNTLAVNFKSSIKIAIDPGHGGYDPGVVFMGVVEKKVTLDISKKLEHSLKQLGYTTATMTRTTDTDLYNLSKIGNTLEKRDLNARAKIINHINANLFVSIHVNSDFYNKKCTGSIVYYYPNSLKSKIIAESIQKSIDNITINNQKRQQHKPRPANFYILRNTRIPGVLIETAFISNKGERKLIKTEKFKNKIALAIAIGIKNSGMYKVINTEKYHKSSNIRKSTKKPSRT